MNDLRKVEIFKDNDWIEIKFKALKVGNKFRMFEPDDGSPVIGKGKTTEWVATSEPYKNKEGILTVSVKD